MVEVVRIDLAHHGNQSVSAYHWSWIDRDSVTRGDILLLIASRLQADRIGEDSREKYPLTLSQSFALDRSAHWPRRVEPDCFPQLRDDVGVPTEDKLALICDFLIQSAPPGHPAIGWARAAMIE